MAIYVFRPQSSTGARELANALEGKRLRRIEGGVGYRLVNGRERRVEFRRGDVIIGWGASVPNMPTQGVRVLNGTHIQNKYDDAVALRRAGVPTVEVSKTIPIATPAVDPALSLHQTLREAMEEFSSAELSRNRVYLRGLNDLATNMQRLTAALQTPAPQSRPAATGEWLARIYNHVGGTDLLTPPAQANYYVKKESIVKEFRVHSFLNKSIRAGAKAHRVDFANPHAWVRSWDGGWRVVYDGIASKQRYRDIAHQAVAALGLQFAAVDIGVRSDKSLIVLECNRAPGIELGTVDAYANAIRKWTTGEWN